MAEQRHQPVPEPASKNEETKEICADMFNKVSEYINGELSGDHLASHLLVITDNTHTYSTITATSEEYDLLLRLNQITIAKYADMAKLAGGLTDVADRLNDKCEHYSLLNLSLPPFPHCPVSSLKQYCDQIDQVEGSVTELEQTAYRLDTYAKQLGECVNMSE